MEPQNHSTESARGCGKSPDFSAALLRYLFHGIAADLDTSGYFMALYSQAPDPADITANELDYPGYRRPEIERSESGWLLDGNTVCNARQVDFPTIETNYEGVVRYFALVTSAEGAGRLRYVGALGSPLAVGCGVTPSAATGAIMMSES